MVHALVYFASLAVFVSGSPVKINEICEPMFRTVGRHYTPDPGCNLDISAVRERQEYLRQKYQEEIDRVDREELEDILVDLFRTDIQTLMDVPDFRCSACTSGVKLFRYMITSNYTVEEILKISEELCVDLNIMYPDMCNGTVKTFGKSLFEVVRRSPLDPMTFCSVLFNGICFHDSANNISWNVNLPQKPKPPVPNLQEPTGKPKLKVLQISDTHWDQDYVEGSPDECRTYLCCRNHPNVPPAGHSKAGKWGGWKCDIPEATFDSFLEHVNAQHKDIDYVLWTGDIPAHDMWHQDVDSNWKILDETAKKLKKAFPKTPIFPALGNHESIPPNLFPTKNHVQEDVISWLYKKLNEEWGTWLPQNSSETILRGGFFDVLIRPGLRIISLNMNYCYNMNWWLMVDGVDPEKELVWLVDALLKAEEKGEKVHIIGHIPPGTTDCVKGWQTNFYNIINRFESTVTAQFYGHMHTDEIEIFYDNKDKNRPFGIAYAAPSLTTYTYLNPGYRIYSIDGDHNETTRYVLDHETWILDLEKSNKENKAHWKQLYSAKTAYNMTSLFPKDWNEVYERVKKDNATVELYHRFQWKDSPKRPVCDSDCKMNMLCHIKSCVQYGKPTL